MDHVPVGPGGSQAPTSSASSVAQPISGKGRHRPTSATDTTSTNATSALGSQPTKKNTRALCRQLKKAKVTRVTNSCINIGYDEWHRVAPTTKFIAPWPKTLVTFQTHCPMQWKSWKVMPDEIKTEVCGQLSRTSTTSRWHTSTNSSLRGTSSGRATCTTILRRLMIRKSLFKRVARRSLRGGRIVGRGSALIFQAPNFVQKSIRAIGRRRLFSTIQVPGPSHIGWMHDDGGSKFQEIDVFGDVYVRPGNELAESLHVNDDGGEEPVGSSGVRLPTSSRYSDQVCGSSIGLGMAIILVGLGPRWVPAPNGGSFRGEIRAGYGDPQICKIPDRGWAGDGIVIPIPEPSPISTSPTVTGTGFPEKPKPGIGAGMGMGMVSGDGDGIVIPGP
ncbi:unnamed protein product [Prunus armeniaca]